MEMALCKGFLAHEALLAFGNALVIVGVLSALRETVRPSVVLLLIIGGLVLSVYESVAMNVV